MLLFHQTRLALFTLLGRFSTCYKEPFFFFGIISAEMVKTNLLFCKCWIYRVGSKPVTLFKQCFFLFWKKRFFRRISILLVWCLRRRRVPTLGTVMRTCPRHTWKLTWRNLNMWPDVLSFCSLRWETLSSANRLRVSSVEQSVLVNVSPGILRPDQLRWFHWRFSFLALQETGCFHSVLDFTCVLYY